MKLIIGQEFYKTQKAEYQNDPFFSHNLMNKFMLQNPLYVLHQTIAAMATSCYS